MGIVLGDRTYKFTIAYMHDAVVFFPVFQGTPLHLEIVLKQLQSAGLTDHPRKMQIASPQSNILSFVADNEVLRPNQDKLLAVTSTRSHTVSEACNVNYE